MRVKIGDTWYSSDDQTLGVQFTQGELDFILASDWAGSARCFGVGTAIPPEEGELDPLVAWIREGRDQ